MRYFIYCRKSTESEDRQILSIDSQLAELQRAFEGNPEIDILEVYRESFSAKAPGRPIFEQMLRRVERGEADGVIAWHPDRLARNSVDGGRIIYLLDQKRLKDMKFASFTFENNPQGKFMLSIIFGYSKYYVDSLSENVKRGNRAKLERGWRPNKAPLGYLNDRENKTIVKDPVRFPLARRMFDLMLTGAYSPRQIMLIARDEWGLRTLQMKRSGGKPLSYSATYQLLSNPFYAGLIVWEGRTYQGKHVPMVTIDEFDRAQALLGRPGRPKPQRRSFAFTGMIRCGACGLMVTAEEKINRYGSRYTYYHCSRRRQLVEQCRQPSVELRDLESQIVCFLRALSLPQTVHQTILAAEADSGRDEADQYRAKVLSIEKALKGVTAQLAELTDLRLRALIRDDEFLKKRQELERERLALTERSGRTRKVEERFEPFADIISFSDRAVDWFVAGDYQAKRLVLETVGSNLFLRDKKLNIEARKPFLRLRQVACFPPKLRDVEDVRTFLDDTDLPTIVRNIKLIRDRMECRKNAA